MQKKNLFSILITSIWFLGTLILALILLEIPHFEIELRDIARIIQGALYLVMSIITLIMSIRLFGMYHLRKTVVIEYLMLFFFWSGIGALLQGVFGIIEFTVREFQVFFTDSAYIFIAASSFSLTTFIIEIFSKESNRQKNKNFQIIAAMICIVSSFMISKNILFEATELEVYLPVLLLLLLTLILYITLIHKSLNLRKRIDEKLSQQAFLLIAISGFFLIIAYLGVLVYAVTDETLFRYLNAFSFMLGYLLLYRGFTLPMKKEINEEEKKVV